MPAPPSVFARDSPLVPKAQTVLQPGVIAMPDGFFAWTQQMRSVTPPEMRKAAPKTAVI
jgi:hypothetical protein